MEVWPADYSPDAFPFGALHNMMIGQLGLALGELWQLDALAQDCDRDGVYEMLLVSSPLNLPGGIGYPANVMVLKSPRPAWPAGGLRGIPRVQGDSGRTR